MSQNHYVKGLFTGFLGGGAIVTLVALLYAPKSGKELRQEIKDKTDNAKLKAKDLVNGGLKIFSDAKSKTDSIITTGKEFIDNEKTKLKTAFHAGVDAYNETINQNTDHS
jgi:gas vesicle protein